MTIRSKTVLVVLPLIIAPLVLSGVISTLSARNGITAVATGFLQFKAEQLVSYAQGQWNLLATNGLEATPAYLDASKAAVESFAKNLVRSPTENIYAVAADGTLAMQSGDLAPAADELAAMKGIAAAGTSGWQTLRIGGISRVGHVVAFAPFKWTFFVTESAGAFYAASDSILRQSIIILGASIAAAVALLYLFARFLTRPLRQVADAMADIIATNDLSRRVEVLYKDETGRLGHTFNLMSEELGKAYAQIKGYALRAAVAGIKEEKIRHIFQKYVPRSVIESFFANPDAMLVGRNSEIAILFSDIRDFTTISETMPPDQMVEVLNQYFSRMIDIVMNREGIVDKFIGDAIMALFGAPISKADDARRSVDAALDMLDALKEFNMWQRERGRRPFRVGVGINYGKVTVGNIGSERKMDYTVIGDMVNVASRLEGLTKIYKAGIIVSDSVQARLGGSLPTRKLDKVAVKGRKGGTDIYEVRRMVGELEGKGWEAHASALALYYARDFAGAEVGFRAVQTFLPDDYCARLYLARCAAFRKTPPPADWEGIEEMTEK